MAEVERRGKYPGVKVHLDPEEMSKLQVLADYLTGAWTATPAEIKTYRKFFVKLVKQITATVEEDPSTIVERTPEQIRAVLEKERNKAAEKLARMEAGEQWNEKEQDMPTAQTDIANWFDQGVKNKADYMLVVCDTYDHEDYPVYAKESEVVAKYNEHNGPNMQRVMEVYDLRMDKQMQLSEVRANHLPKS